MVTNTKHHFTAASLRKQFKIIMVLCCKTFKTLFYLFDLVTIEISCLDHFTGRANTSQVAREISVQLETWQLRMFVRIFATLRNALGVLFW